MSDASSPARKVPAAPLPPPEALAAMGGREAFELLRQLLELDTTNLEDPAHHREEKRHYVEAARFLEKQARDRGLRARVWDAREELPEGKKQFASPRPNVVVDLDRGRPHTLLLLAHMDVVPVPQEQLARWQSPPHELTWRAGPARLYGRGSNDDLGSGVLSTMMALGRLAETRNLPANLRLLICPDEETGGAGGIEAIAEHDRALPSDSPQRFLRGEVALIPDGAPYVAAGCSGVAFIEFGLQGPAPLADHLSLADGVLGFEPTAQSWVSRLPSPDYPDKGAPDPHITGRATLTKMDLEIGPGHAPRAEAPRLDRAHAESEAANQIPASVSLTFQGDPARVDALVAFLEKHVTEPFRLVLGTAQGPASPSGASSRAVALSVVGRSGHGGYPHKAANPVPVTVGLLRAAAQERLLDAGAMGTGGFTLDLRSPPEMPSEDVMAIFDNRFARLVSELPKAAYQCPPSRRRAGYALDPGHPALLAVRQAFEEVAHHPIRVFGEYGGTDASALRGLTTPGGAPLPAIVVGAMDEEAHIHDAEESADPRLLGQVQELIVRWATEWRPSPPAP